MIVDPDDQRFFRSTQGENVDEVMEMRQEMKLFEHDYPKVCEEIETKYKRRLMAFNKIWSRDVRCRMHNKIVFARKKRIATYLLIESHRESTEIKRTKDNRKLKQKLLSLDRARIKMIENRYQWKTNYLNEKFNMERMMITETYDTVIKQLKDNHNVIYVNTQQFFRDTAENDILLIISLRNELKNLQDNMEKMEEEIKVMNAGIKKIKGPLEESEKETRWMETFVSAISKDAKSLASHKKSNEELQKTIETLQQDCKELEIDLKLKEESLKATNNLKENVNQWSNKYRKSNAFVKLMKNAFDEDSKKIERMEESLVSKGLILREHIPLVRELVDKKVKAAKRLQFARQAEVKAFNELIQQLEIRSKNLLINTWPKVYKMGGVPYRKTPANLLTANESDKLRNASQTHLFDFLNLENF